MRIKDVLSTMIQIGQYQHKQKREYFFFLALDVDTNGTLLDLDIHSSSDLGYNFEHASCLYLGWIGFLCVLVVGDSEG